VEGERRKEEAHTNGAPVLRFGSYLGKAEEEISTRMACPLRKTWLVFQQSIVYL
jgi:hypothetical protein